MKPTLKTGLAHRFAYKVPDSKTVPHTYPEAPEIASMPNVFATGFMVALMEWTCMQLLAPHLDSGEGSVGVHVDVSHVAATPVGMTVTVDVECVEVVGPRSRSQSRRTMASMSSAKGAMSASWSLGTSSTHGLPRRRRRRPKWRGASGEWRVADRRS
jgi:predicted thioesterase